MTFYLPRFRYVAPRPYTREEYQYLHDWMTNWGLLDRESNNDRIIGARLTASAKSRRPQTGHRVWPWSPVTPSPIRSSRLGVQAAGVQAALGPNQTVLL